MARFLSTCFLILISAQLVKSSAVFELKLHSFTNNSILCKESTDCQAVVRVCLNHTENVISNKVACSTGAGSISTLITDQSFISTCVPITVPYNLNWLGRVSVTIEEWTGESSDDLPTENENNMIGHTASNINLTFGKKWSQNVHLGEQNELRFSYRVMCSKFYSGDDCSKICRPRDGMFGHFNCDTTGKKSCRPRNDMFGHFNCDAAGKKICLSGWKGENCLKPICRSGCSEEHGGCSSPGQCTCKYGWQGLLCDECIPYPGCVYGTCKMPWQCNCKEACYAIVLKMSDVRVSEFSLFHYNGLLWERKFHFFGTCPVNNSIYGKFCLLIKHNYYKC